MSRRWTLAAVFAAGTLLLPSSAVLQESSTVDPATTWQLTVAARTLLQRRSQALVLRQRRDRRPPSEILGVRISPGAARVQEHAVRELETRNRAPVAGGPVYTGARTRLDHGRAVRAGDRITLEATEHTEVRYRTGRVTQSIRRRFDFTARGREITLVGERVLDPSVDPADDPDRPTR